MKINKILLIIAVVFFVILIGLCAIFVALFGDKIGISRPYYAVYLSTGDIYFGKPGFFSHSTLSDVWFLQRNPQDSQNPFSISRLQSAFWGPYDKLYLNGKNVIWKTKLRQDSQVLTFIKNSQKQTSNTPIGNGSAPIPTPLPSPTSLPTKI